MPDCTSPRRTPRAFALPGEIRADLIELATARGMDPSELVEEILARWLKNQRRPKLRRPKLRWPEPMTYWRAHHDIEARLEVRRQETGRDREIVADLDAMIARYRIAGELDEERFAAVKAAEEESPAPGATETEEGK